MTQTDIPRPESGDVVELIIDDHRLFESAHAPGARRDPGPCCAARGAVRRARWRTRRPRRSTSTRALVKTDAIEGEDAEHSEHEHHEINEALLGLLEVDDTASEDFGDAVEELTKALTHHLDEEEREILNPARTDVDTATKAELGEKFAAERSRLLDADCGSVDNVRTLVEAAKAEDD
ncbi:MAG: hemerythrin domain-containing protein [Nocardioidaceae bacterium]